VVEPSWLISPACGVPQPRRKATRADS
jgi:hypothetical protein